jgi:lysozyme family protein
MHKAEELILRTLTKWEGRHDNDPDDIGGETNWGIAENFHPGASVNSIDDAVLIAKQEYYDALNLDLIQSPRIRWKLFDIAFNMGTDDAELFLQEVQRKLWVTPDGKLGPITASAINRQSSVDWILALLVELQATGYVERVIDNPVKIKWLRGWTRRAFDTASELA